MAGFLRKKATLSTKVLRDTSPPHRLSSDAPPSLPPLLLSLSLADPDQNTRALPPAASPPVVSLPTPAQEYLCLDDVWDPWKAYADAPSAPRLDSHVRQKPALPQPARDTPPSAPAAPQPASNDVPNRRNTLLNPVATVSSPRKISPTRQVQTLPQPTHPKSDALGNQSLTHKPRPPSSSSVRPSSPPAVVRGQMAPTSNFDFEESLSAANVTSVVNQFRSYPPPVRHHTSPAPPSQGSQMGIQRLPSSTTDHHHVSPQKPGSSSSHSSSSHNTDATRRTDGSYGSSTSASSVPPATEVIDVRTDTGRRLDSVGSSFSNSHSAFAANASSPSVVGRRSSIDHNPSAITSPTSRPFTSPNVTTRVHRPSTAPSVPPTSYPERVRTLARQTPHSGPSSSTANTEPHARPPMLYDMHCSDSVGPLRKGPLIFAAMSATPQSGLVPLAASPHHGNMGIHNPYPSPPVEYASLDTALSQRRNGPIITNFRSTSQVDPRSQEGLGGGSNSHPTELLPLARKSSRSSVAVDGRGDVGSEYSRPRVLTKARPTTPQKPSSPPFHTVLPEPGDPLFLDDDPFARVEGVKMLKPRARSSSTSGTPSGLHMSKEDVSSSEDGQFKISAYGTPPSSIPEKSPPTPVTPDDYKVARQQRRGQWLEKVPPAVAEAAKQLEEGEQVEEQPREPTPPPTYFPIIAFMSDANLLPVLLSYLTYSEWLGLYSANKQVRDLFQSRILREFVLERYLSTVGYSKWDYEWAEPLALSLKASLTPPLCPHIYRYAHQYARLSAAYLQPKIVDRDIPTTSDAPDILALALTTRAYTRVVLRLRSQAESEDRYIKTLRSAELNQTTNTSRPGTRQPSVSSRAASPTSSYSHSRNHSHGKNERTPSSSSLAVSNFKSPLYRHGRAPVLRVFVPSPEGDWLSDAGVVECEAELKRSGVLKLLRVGDIVWDLAVGDEGNLGRLVWDGSYLVDLDYRYSRVGELSPYFHSLAFSPSYFHRVIRIGGSATHNPHCNPIVYVDVSPWGREIAANLQLLQDRARTETPHNALHDVVRWVHRSTFTIRPPVPPSQGQTHSRSRAIRVPIPNADGFYIDPGWYGTVVIESEGTNEGLTDLQARCGPGVFPPRAETLATKMRNEKEKENRRVWRVLREKSRPGELWLRAVHVRERLM
ncbi:hypothetical protein J3R83DRAFT_3164 [Lanmaoa asiatica]|nr:hypothetical protein J3R83DRAFT_3164 [Lanmaoa asiatica]